MKGADELSEDAVACIKRIVAQYDAQASEKKSALRNIVRKKVIKDKDWEALRKIFNESPLVGIFNSYSNSYSIPVLHGIWRTNIY